jgi:DNA-directed RNA polymerase subunit RPC12/RpoP
MSVVFFCQSCGSRFEVDARMAGKKGRCKKCGEQMTVPARGKAAAPAATPHRVTVGASTAVAAGVGSATSPAPGWLGEVEASKVSLAPLTVDRMPALKKPTMFPEDDQADSKPYVLAQPERRSGGRVVTQVSKAKILWRSQLSAIARVFRWMNQAAYLISVPFLMILLLGILVRSHAMANFGAVVVVLLNIARLATGLVNIVVIPFRDGLDFRKLKKPIRRVIEPVVTIGLVGVAFAVIPWLSKSDGSDGTMKGRIRGEIKKIERKLQDVKDGTSKKAKALGVTPAGKQPET